jgi:chromosomal replication initiation ATPase DnaA
MTLTDNETEALKRILTRELTMIGGERDAAKWILDKLNNPDEVIPTAYEQKVLDTVAAFYRISPKAIMSRVRKHPIPSARVLVAYHLFKSGKSQRSIAQLLTVDRCSVYHYIQQFDYPHIQAAINEIGRIER